MWLKLLFLLLYVLLLFLVARILEALAWCEPGWSGLPSCSSYSCRLLDPMLMSVVQMKALLEQRGLSYEGVVEKSELTSLISTSGQVTLEEAEQSLLEDPSTVETNFTSGAHFIDQVEDAKDSVWLVQVSGLSPQQTGKSSYLLGDSRWTSLKRKLAKFGVRMGRFDCSLDVRYCRLKDWHSPFFILAMPSQHQKKANVAMYNFSSLHFRETSLLRWTRSKLDERINRIEDIDDFKVQWQNFGQQNSFEPEIRAVLFTTAEMTPLFYSALSVKFPGRVKFGLVSMDPHNASHADWWNILRASGIAKLPAYEIYTAEKNYTYGFRPGEHFSFAAMERFFKTLYPCLNDIFIVSFCLANVVSWLEPFVSNCGLLKRFKKFCWCVFKYNLMVIMLWLPLIAVFQMPYLDRIPLLALKWVRMFSTSSVGQIIRGDYNFYYNNSGPVMLSFLCYVLVLAFLCKRYRSEETDESNDWLNFSQMRTLTYLRPNDLFEPMRVGRYDLLSGLDVFGSSLSQPSLWLTPQISPAYIQHLPTWTFRPVSLATRAQANVASIQAVLMSESHGSCHTVSDGAAKEGCVNSACSVVSEATRQFPNDTPHSPSLVEQTCHGSNAPPVSESCDCPSSGQISRSPYPVCGPTDPHTGSRHQGSCQNCEKNKGATAGKFGTSSCRNFSSGQSSTSPPQRWVRLEGTPLCLSSPNVENELGPMNNTQSTGCYGCSNSRMSHGSGTKRTLSINPSENPTTSFRSHSSSHLPNPDQPPPAELHPVSDQHECESQGASPAYAPSQPRSGRGSGFPMGYLECHQCVICLEDYVPLDSLCGLPCGHVFHEKCIISWLNREKHFCPMCRWPSYIPKSPAGSNS